MAELMDLGEFTGEEDAGGFGVIDSGRYHCTVFELTREIGKQSGEPYLKWCYQICEDQPFAGRRIWDNTSLKPGAKWRIVQVLKACGIDVPKGHLKINPNEILGTELVITVGQELDQYANDRDGTEDQMRNTIKGFSPATGTKKPKMNIPDVPQSASKPAAKKAPKKTAKAVKKVKEVVDEETEETEETENAPSEKQDVKVVQTSLPFDEDDDDDSDFDFE